MWPIGPLFVPGPASPPHPLLHHPNRNRLAHPQRLNRQYPSSLDAIGITTLNTAQIFARSAAVLISRVIPAWLAIITIASTGSAPCVAIMPCAPTECPTARCLACGKRSFRAAVAADDGGGLEANLGGVAGVGVGGVGHYFNLKQQSAEPPGKTGNSALGFCLDQISP